MRNRLHLKKWLATQPFFANLRHALNGCSKAKYIHRFFCCCILPASESQQRFLFLKIEKPIAIVFSPSIMVFNLSHPFAGWFFMPIPCFSGKG
jgi:hypothetical protein